MIGRDGVKGRGGKHAIDLDALELRVVSVVEWLSYKAAVAAFYLAAAVFLVQVFHFLNR